MKELKRNTLKQLIKEESEHELEWEKLIADSFLDQVFDGVKEAMAEKFSDEVEADHANSFFHGSLFFDGLLDKKELWASIKDSIKEQAKKYAEEHADDIKAYIEPEADEDEEVETAAQEVDRQEEEEI